MKRHDRQRFAIVRNSRDRRVRMRQHVTVFECTAESKDTTPPDAGCHQNRVVMVPNQWMSLADTHLQPSGGGFFSLVGASHAHQVLARLLVAVNRLGIAALARALALPSLRTSISGVPSPKSQTSWPTNGPNERT